MGDAPRDQRVQGLRTRQNGAPFPLRSPPTARHSPRPTALAGGRAAHGVRERDGSPGALQRPSVLELERVQGFCDGDVGGNPHLTDGEAVAIIGNSVVPAYAAHLLADRPPRQKAVLGLRTAAPWAS